MRKIIGRRFAEIVLISIFSISMILTFVFYAQLKRQVFSDLESVTTLLADEGVYDKKTRNLRITVIDSEGNVEFDSKMDGQSLENHLDRPEVKDALKTGVGKEVRLSDTLAKNVFYYAMKLENGKILRVGQLSDSVIAVFMQTMPIVFSVSLLLVAVCLFLARYLTLAIVRPIDEMAGNLDEVNNEDIYPELRPFISKIRAQHEEIVASANIRQEFTANVTHELKTPLTAISGYAELMENGVVKEEDVKHFSSEIRRNASRLLILINDIIRLSSLDAGAETEQLTFVNLAAIAKESVDVLSLEADRKSVVLKYEGDDRADVKLGSELAQELVYNLVENAIRYNRKGGAVLVKVENDADGITFSVKDTGIGIAKEHQVRVFERFYRVDKSRSKQLGGTGLGLAIVKHICTLSGAEISLISEQDMGTEIIVRWQNTSENIR